jgi:hypothetical protein
VQGVALDALNAGWLTRERRRANASSIYSRTVIMPTISVTGF